MAHGSASFQADAVVEQRTIALGHTVSMAFLDLQGAKGRQFSVQEYTMRQIMFGKGAQSASTDDAGLLKRVHVSRIIMQPGTENQLPVDIGVQIAGFSGGEYGNQGEQWSYIMPSKFLVTTPTTIFQSNGDEKLMTSWERDFARWTSENLETLLVMQLPESEVVLVHLDHPVARYLEKRAEEAGTMPLGVQPASTPNWRQISLILFNSSVAWIRENILSKSSQTFDMSTLRVTYDRVNSEKFSTLTAGCLKDMPLTGEESTDDLNTKKEKYANIILQRPFSVNLKITFEFRIGVREQPVF